MEKRERDLSQKTPWGTPVSWRATWGLLLELSPGPEGHYCPALSPFIFLTEPMFLLGSVPVPLFVLFEACQAAMWNGKAAARASPWEPSASQPRHRVMACCASALRAWCWAGEPGPSESLGELWLAQSCKLFSSEACSCPLWLGKGQREHMCSPSWDSASIRAPISLDPEFSLVHRTVMGEWGVCPDEPEVVDPGLKFFATWL